MEILQLNKVNQRYKKKQLIVKLEKYCIVVEVQKKGNNIMLLMRQMMANMKKIPKRIMSKMIKVLYAMRIIKKDYSIRFEGEENMERNLMIHIHLMLVILMEKQ